MERTFRLGEYPIDPSTNTIGDARVDAKAMDVLVALANVAPEVLSSGSLLETVWSTVVVGDNVVHQAIAHLRKALGDDARRPRFIEHVPRRGYRLIARVNRDAATSGTVGAGGLLHNLPSPLNSFVGRAAEISEVRKLLAEHRLVTLVGPGGVGKTRLAVVLASGASERHRDGAWLVELASISSEQVVQAINDVLRVPEVPGRSPEAALLAALVNKDLVLVLDTCEHVIVECARVVHALLQRSPQLRVLTTSREVLDVAGEHAWHVPPLPAHDCVELFADRAREVQPGFTVTDENVGILEEIGTRLDGLPLAIELAAARARTLTVQQIQARLHDRFRLLTDGRRTALPRQQTLRATLDWSYALLDDGEKALLRRIGVFEGSFTLEAAEAINDAEAEVKTSPTIDVLSRLMDKSWVQVAPDTGDVARYRQLETVKQYALERLEEAGEEPSARDRHRDYYCALAERSNLALRGREQRRTREMLDAEHDNLSAALVRSEKAGDGRTLRLVAHLWRYWMMRGFATHGRRALEDALGRAPIGPTFDAWRASALLGAGWLARFQGDSGIAQRHLTQATELYRELGDSAGEAEALMNLAANLFYLGDADEAQRLGSRALELARRADDPYVTSYCLQTFGDQCAGVGDDEAGRTLLNESVALLRGLGHEQSLAFALAKLGSLLLNEGELALARSALEEAHTLHRILGEGLGIDHTLLRLGWLAHHEGNDEEARRLLERSLEIAEQAGFVPEAALAMALLGRLAFHRGEVDEAETLLTKALHDAVQVRAYDVCATSLEGLASIANERTKATHAAELLGAASRVRATARRPMVQVERGEHARVVRAARSASSKAAFDSAWRRGEARSLEELVRRLTTAP